MIESPSPRYFAASNSANGFRNYYGDIFTDDRVDCLYIIKGGPGTGKSYFMKTVAEQARRRDYAVTEYACSSDPTSLDGLILEKEGAPTVGFVDGTPPHPREPALPGVREELVHLGAFWNRRLLSERAEDICRLTTAKGAAYRRAYAYLAACGDLDEAVEERLEDCARSDRIDALADRILRGQPRGSKFSPIPALRRGIGMTGETCLPTFERESARRGGTVLILEDHYGAAFRLTRALYERSRQACHRLYVSYDPVYPHKIDGLHYPDSGLSVLAGGADTSFLTETGTAMRAVPLRRLIDAQVLREARGEARRAYALREQLTECALQALAQAGKYHFEMESIYAGAMDFGAKEAFTKTFCYELFSE